MKDGEPNMYAGIANVRNGYYQQQWSRVQMFLVFNTVALPIVLGAGTGTTNAVKFILSTMGFIIDAFILTSTFRANRFIDFFDRKLAELEMLDPDSDNSARVQVFTDPVFIARRTSRVAGHKVFGLICGVFVIAWCLLGFNYGLLVVR